MTEKNNEQGNKTLFVFDYDNTIAFGTDGMFYYVIDQFIGEGETAKMLSRREKAGIIEDFIVNGDNIEFTTNDGNTENIKYDKAKIIECLKKFTNESPLYKELQKLDNEEVKATLSEIEKLSANFEEHKEFELRTPKQFRRYFMENIVAKISAYNNVYICNLKPQKAFFDIVEKTKAHPNDFELVINTFKQKAFIRAELETWKKVYESQGQTREARLIRSLVKNRIFSSNKKHSKVDNDVIHHIIKVTNSIRKIDNIYDNIYILGDSYPDEKSYNSTKQLKNYKNKNINFFLINGVLLNILKEKTNQLQQNVEKLKTLEKKLAEQKQKLEKDKNIKIFSDLEQVLTYLTENNIIKGQSNNIVQP